LLQLARQLLSLPTAPYHEHAVRAAVTDYVVSLGLQPQRDPAGNLLIRWEPPRPRRATPLVLVAHMDHPGFEALGSNRAEFLGGVPDKMFRGRPAVRFYTAGGVVRARVRRARKKQIELTGGAALRGGEMGQWDLPPVSIRGDKLVAPGIDDVLGVVAALAALTDIVRQRVPVRVWCLFTRAEEVGFHGALGAVRRAKLPRRALFISLEMSRERPWARQGDGPVIRIGDRLTVFDPWATMFLEQAAKQAGVRAQRCLMDGGTCEASVFNAFGYRCGGLCLPLGNYHNIGPDQRPASEYIRVSDLTGLVELLVAAARQWRGVERLPVELRRKLRQFERCAPRKLIDR
jgi:endoglucanase